MTRLREINRYLAAEFGEDEATVREDAPFVLHAAGTSRGEPVFSFEHDGERFYAWGGSCLQLMRACGMTVADLEAQELGSAWLAAAAPVDLDTSMLGYDDVPPTFVRRERVEALCELAGVGGAPITEGLYLRRDRLYLAVVQGIDGATAVYSDATVLRVPFPRLAAFRCLAWAVGQRLASITPSTAALTRT